METQKTQIAKVILRLKKNKDRDDIIADFKIYHKAVVIQTVWYLHKNRQHRSMDQKTDPRNKPPFPWLINL